MARSRRPSTPSGDHNGSCEGRLENARQYFFEIWRLFDPRGCSLDSRCLSACAFRVRARRSSSAFSSRARALCARRRSARNLFLRASGSSASADCASDTSARVDATGIVCLCSATFRRDSGQCHSAASWDGPSRSRGILMSPLRDPTVLRSHASDVLPRVVDQPSPANQ